MDALTIKISKLNRKGMLIAIENEERMDDVTIFETQYHQDFKAGADHAIKTLKSLIEKIEEFKSCKTPFNAKSQEEVNGEGIPYEE